MTLVCGLTANRTGRRAFRQECERLSIVALPVQFQREVPDSIPDNKDLWDYCPLAVQISARDDGPILDLFESIHNRDDVAITAVTHPLSAAIPFRGATGTGDETSAGARRAIRETKISKAERYAIHDGELFASCEQTRKANQTPFEKEFEYVKSGAWQARQERKRRAALTPDDREQEDRTAIAFLAMAGEERKPIEPHESSWTNVVDCYYDRRTDRKDIFGSRW
jgi:hypothetical protein